MLPETNIHHAYILDIANSIYVFGSTFHHTVIKNDSKK